MQTHRPFSAKKQGEGAQWWRTTNHVPAKPAAHLCGLAHCVYTYAPKHSAHASMRAYGSQNTTHPSQEAHGCQQQLLEAVQCVLAA